MADRVQSQAKLATTPRSRRLRKLEGFLDLEATGTRDRLVYQRIRLGILSALAVNESVAFTELRQLLGTTDGNLAVHARKLEDAGLVDCSKSFEGRVPKTEYSLTAAGRRSLERYLDHMEALLEATRGTH